MVQAADEEEKYVLLFQSNALMNLPIVGRYYAFLDYSVQDIENAAGGPATEAGCGNPSLSLHGIEGAFSGVGGPRLVIAARWEQPTPSPCMMDAS